MSKKNPPRPPRIPRAVLQQLAELVHVPPDHREFFFDELRAHVQVAIELDTLGKSATKTVEAIRRCTLTLYEAVSNLTANEGKLVEKMFRKGGGLFDRISDRGLCGLSETTYQLALLFSLATGKPKPRNLGGGRSPRKQGKSPGGRRPGSIKEPVFLDFVLALRISVKTAGGKLRFDKNVPRGNLLPALKMLDPYLPNGFVPIAPGATTLRNLFNQISAADKAVDKLDKI